MYAVIRTGGKQYRVRPGDLLVVEKLDGEPGAKIAFGDVLMLGEGDAVTVGVPLVEGAKVQATLIETRKGEKIKIFKKIRRQGYRRTKGHRQLQSVLRVTAIAGAGQEAKWDGEVKLTTKAELDARARGLTYVAPGAAAEAKPAKKAAQPKPAKTAEEVVASPEVKEAMAAAEINAPVAEAPAKKPATAPKPTQAKAKPAAKAEPKAEAAAKPAAKKAAAPKAAAPKAAAPKAAAAEKKPAAKKPAAKKDKDAK